MVNKPSAKSDLPIPKRLRQLRAAEGYESAFAFATRLEVSAGRYGNVEAGAALSIDMAQRIVKHVPGMTLDWLYNGVENGLTLDLRQRLAAQAGGAARGTSVKTVAPRSARSSTRRSAT